MLKKESDKLKELLDQQKSIIFNLEKQIDIFKENRKQDILISFIIGLITGIILF